MKILVADSIPETRQFLLEDQQLEASKVYEVPSHVGHMLIAEGIADYAPVGAANIVEREERRSIIATQTFLDGHDRFEEGETYPVPKSLADYFVGNGWAKLTDKSPKAKDLAQPLDTREVSDEFAEELEREVHAPARESSRVETIRVDEQGNRHSFGTRSGAEAVDLDVHDTEQSGDAGF